MQIQIGSISFYTKPSNSNHNKNEENNPEMYEFHTFEGMGMPSKL